MDRGPPRASHRYEPRVIDIGDRTYLAAELQGGSKVLIPETPSGVQYATVVRVPHNFSGDARQDIFKQLKLLRDNDDVWQDEFAAGIIIDDPLQVVSHDITQHALGFPHAWFTIINDGCLETGPHILWNGIISRALRLYDDNMYCFMTPLAPDSTSKAFKPLGLSGRFPQCSSVAVPTKALTETTSADNITLLTGKRIAVKEVFDMAGLRTSLSNRGYYAVSEPSNTTAPALDRLLQAGAVIVGVTKTSTLISREDPVESADFQAPFNPRGEGFQSPVGSSSGSAAAIASYRELLLPDPILP